jgi:prolipoprotein diacylglyceryl transferase
LGARLGDVFFYSWDYYQNHWVEILLPIRGNPSKELFFGLISGYEFIGFRGLASHGATIGVLIGLYLYQRKYKFKPLIWILDRLVIPISIGAAFVRIGNFFNSEIVGKYTNTNVGVVFQNRGEVLPRHPAQLYEAFGYIILFFAIKKFYDNGFGERKGFLLGFFFTGLFAIRFIVEYIKESQGGFEEILPMFTTGQWLSIPFILVGIFIMFYSKKNKIL